MNILQELINENNSLWTEDYEREVISILENWEPGVKRPRMHYPIHEKFELKSLAGITKVIKKKDSRLIATKSTVLSAISDTHNSIGHKGEKKTYNSL